MPLIFALANALAPLILRAYHDHQAAHDGVPPTLAELEAHLRTHLDTYLADGDAWFSTPPAPSASTLAGRRRLA